MGVEFVFEQTDLVLDKTAINNMMYGGRGEVVEDLKRRARLIYLASQRQVGVDTGNLKQSGRISYHTRGIIPEVWITYHDDIALLHHEGSRPHAIEARGPKMLRYSSRGRIAYARRVEHPGTEPNRYLSDNLYLAGG